MDIHIHGKPENRWILAALSQLPGLGKNTNVADNASRQAAVLLSYHCDGVQVCSTLLLRDRN